MRTSEARPTVDIALELGPHDNDRPSLQLGCFSLSGCTRSGLGKGVKTGNKNEQAEPCGEGGLPGRAHWEAWRSPPTVVFGRVSQGETSTAEERFGEHWPAKSRVGDNSSITTTHPDSERLSRWGGPRSTPRSEPFQTQILALLFTSPSDRYLRMGKCELLSLITL